MYEYTDLIIKYLDNQYIELFSKLKSLTSYDEVNVLWSVRELFSELHSLVRKMYVKLAEKTYRDTVRKEIRKLDEQWVNEILDAYDPTTKYVFSHEEDRKSGRLVEALIASSTKSKEVDIALRYWSLMSREYAIRITDKAQEQAFRDDSEEYLRWVTEEDDRVCEICASRDGKLYEIDFFPPKPHIGCRCHLERG